MPMTIPTVPIQEVPLMTKLNDAPATATKTPDGWSVRFERRLNHRPEKVWSALTESEHLQHWMPCDLVGERRAGAVIALPFWPAFVTKYAIETPTLTGTIRVWDPPNIFEWTWDTDVLRFELTPTDFGTLLVFTTQLTGDHEGTAKTAAGYHACLGNLSDLLDGASVRPLLDAEVEPLEDLYRGAITPT